MEPTVHPEVQTRIDTIVSVDQELVDLEADIGSVPAARAIFEEAAANRVHVANTIKHAAKAQPHNPEFESFLSLLDMWIRSMVARHAELLTIGEHAAAVIAHEAAALRKAMNQCS